ncbi:MAG: hypothetical protein SPG61_01455 [Arcanobacterium sp.]|nr:hypothetical protein [Arcanobacterium sp.]
MTENNAFEDKANELVDKAREAAVNLSGDNETVKNIAEKVDSALENVIDGAGDAATGLVDKVKGLFGKN